MKLNINPDKYEKNGVYINYLANYENSLNFLDVLKLFKEFHSKFIKFMSEFYIGKRLIERRIVKVKKE